MPNVVKVAVTGAAGQVSYSMLARLASGEVFGPDTVVVLHLLEIPKRPDWTPPTPTARQPLDVAEGNAMELLDCGFATLKDVVVTDDPLKAFDGVNWALLVGSAPRGPGMERRDLLNINGKIFVGQGKALAARAAPDVQVLVVGNPCNTNCLVAYQNGADIPAERWHAMTRLDHNRAVSALAQKAGAPNADVTCMTIWGNHSSSQFPDFTNARVGGLPVADVVSDRAWLETSFVPGCQNRGAAIIKARGLSSALSAGNGAIDHVKSLVHGTPAGDWTSTAVVSQGQYGVPPGLVFGYPVTVAPGGKYQVVLGLKHDAYGQAMLDATLAELLEERDAVKELLPA